MDPQSFQILAQQAGFARVGFCSASDFAAQKQIVDSQAPLAERRQLRFFPVEDDPRTKSLAVLLWPYAQAAAPQPGNVFVDSYYFASNAAYHAAQTLEQALVQSGHFARANVSYPAREAAIRAGLGILLKSGLLLTPQYGTRVVIILMATDIECPQPEHSAPAFSCLNCNRCAEACPSGALSKEGMSHPERCMRNFMMEGIPVPEPLRSRMGMRLLGCDICQRVCPMQPSSAEQEGKPLPLDGFLTLDEAAFARQTSLLAEQIGRNVARPQRIRAQAALLAGNRGNPKDLPVLRSWAQSPFEAVRLHALWAIGQIEAGTDGGERA